MPGSQAPLLLLSPGGFLFNPGGQVGVGQDSPFASILAQNLAAQNQLPVTFAFGQAITSGQVTSGAPFVVQSNFTVFTSVAASGVAQLNPAVSGYGEILNRGVNTLTVYPQLLNASGQIEALGNNVGVAVASGANFKYLYAGVNGVSGNQWYEP